MYFQIIDRETARLHGLKRFFTGEPCVRGSHWERRTSSAHCLCQFCKEAIAKQSSKYRNKNSEKLKLRWVNEKEKLIEQHKQWYLKNRNHVLEKKVQDRKANPEKYKNKGKEHYQKNREARLQKGKEYREQNRAILNAKAATTRANKYNAVPSWYGELDEFVLVQAYELRELRDSLTGFKWNVDHMVPINGFNFIGLHVWNNFQVIPHYLNGVKGNKLVFTEPNEWFEYSGHHEIPR